MTATRKVGTALDLVNANAVQKIPTGTRVITSANGVADWPATEPCSMTFVKRSPSSRLLVNIVAQFYLNGAGQLNFYVDIDGTDTKVIAGFCNQVTEHVQLSGWKEITGVSAGSHTIKVNAEMVAGGIDLSSNIGDTISLMVMEVPAVSPGAPRKLGRDIGVFNAKAVQKIPTGVRTITGVVGASDWPATEPCSITFIKRLGDSGGYNYGSKLLINAQAGFYINSATFFAVYVDINGSTIKMMDTACNQVTEHDHRAAWLAITGMPAGSYTIKLRVDMPTNAVTMSCDTADTMSLMVMEVPV